MPQTLTLLYGLPGAGKSTYAHPPQEVDTVVISRDVIGGTVKQLVPRVRRLLEEGKSVVLDNTHLTAESRAPFVELAQSLSIPVHCTVIDTPMETCQINVLRRMWAIHGQCFHTGKKGDAQAYAPVTLYVGRKKAEPPTVMEGFDSINILPAVVPAWPKEHYSGKALFLDIDGTLRASEQLPHKYPTTPAEVTLLHEPTKMRAVLERFKADGYILIGVSNQSGVAKGTLTATAVEACFEKTRALLGYSATEFPILYCPHAAAPPSCYCRKPQAGMFVEACERFRIHPASSLMVGDMKTDETAATRIGIPFQYAEKFWAQELKKE